MPALLRTFRSALALLAVLTLAFAPANAQKNKRKRKPTKATPKIEYFEGEFDAAKKQALERNVPLFVMALSDEPFDKAPGREDDDGKWRELMRTNSELAVATQGALVVLANPGTHEIETIQVKNEEGDKLDREVCALFHTKNCMAHKRNWDTIYAEYGDFEEEDAGWKLPDMILMHPDGKELWRKNDGHYPKVSGVISHLKDAKKKAGPGISARELAEVKRFQAKGQKSVETKNWGEAWRAWDGVLAIVPGGPFAEEAGRGQPQALSAMRAELQETLTLVVPGSATDAYDKLLALKEAYADTPSERDAKKAIKQAESNASTKEVIRTHKLELEAEAIWKEVQAFERDGAAGKAKRHAKKLMNAKFAATKATARALEKYPDLAKK